MDQRSKLEEVFESLFWKSRLITFLAVIFSLLAALTLFLAGSIQVLQAVIEFYHSVFIKPLYNELVIHIISSIDLFLIGIVLLIFSFGVYELFISKIDPARLDKDINILEIKSLDGLKNKLLKVIVMVLVVYFFKTILSSHFHEPLEILYLGAAVLMTSACTFFIRKIED